MSVIAQILGADMPITEQQKLATVVEIFETLFIEHYRVCLIGGAQEPLYRPASGVDDLNRIFYRADYLSSALHEVAHWCIAGQERLLMQDFGYWYRPDGRSNLEQRQFEEVEIKPQALEWMFSIACGHRFSVSLDNLDGSDIDDCAALQSFKHKIAKQCIEWCQLGKLPSRADRFIEGLMATFAALDPYDADLYQSSLGC